MNAPSQPAARTPRGRALRVLAIGAFVILALPFLAWSTGALLYDLPLPHPWRATVSAIWAATALGVPIFVRPRRWALIGVAATFLVILVWWRTLSPSNSRDWQPDVARLASALIDGERIMIENVRNCDYRSETDFDARWETRTYQLADLRGADVFITTWGSPYMAHPIVSFDFGPGGHVCFSIETRKERGETYSAIGGLYRQYELVYVVADERDVIRLRTNFRKGEEVHLYRFTIPLNVARERFLGYIRRINELAARPEFYNAVTDNCTTSIRLQADPNQRQPFDYRMLINGRLDELLYERGVIDRTVPFEALRSDAHINERARGANDSPEFSARIRGPMHTP